MTFSAASLLKISMMLRQRRFPDEKKCTEVVLVDNKKNKKDENNHRPISILSNISKLF